MQANQEFLHGLVKKAEHQCHDTGYNQPSFWYGYEMQKAAMYKAARDDERRKKQESGGMSPLMMAALGAGGLGAGYGLHNMMSGSGDIPIEPGSLGMQGPGEMPSGPSIGLAEALSNFYPGGEKERSQAAVRGGINDMYHKLMSYLPRTETSQSLPPADIANSFDAGAAASDMVAKDNAGQVLSYWGDKIKNMLGSGNEPTGDQVIPGIGFDDN